VFTADAARIIGITPKQLRMFLRNQNWGVGSGARYELSHEDVQKLNELFWKGTRRRPVSSRQGWLKDGGSPGLPHEWLLDPNKQAAFIAERCARLERLSARLREAGLDVPQMTEQDLKVNHRAIALTQLLGLGQ
jgi:hypothetical protein